MTPRAALRHIEYAHSLDDAAEHLSWQMGVDGRYMMAQHVSLLRLTAPQNAKAGMAIIYDIAGRYGFVPRPYTDADLADDDDVPF